MKMIRYHSIFFNRLLFINISSKKHMTALSEGDRILVTL